jgi:hypothetical protein
VLARAHALVVAAAVALVVAASIGVGEAGVVAVPTTKTTIVVPDAWTTVQAAGVVMAYKGPAGQLLAITRAQVPNPDAWRSKTRDAYVDEIERGIASKIAGYKRTARTIGDARGVPALDLEARRKDGARLVIRVLLFRTYALALAIEVPRDVDLGLAREIARSFMPIEPVT